jgi:hypothetical protein
MQQLLSRAMRTASIKAPSKPKEISDSLLDLMKTRSRVQTPVRCLASTLPPLPAHESHPGIPETSSELLCVQGCDRASSPRVGDFDLGAYAQKLANCVKMLQSDPNSLGSDWGVPTSWPRRVLLKCCKLFLPSLPGTNPSGVPHARSFMHGSILRPKEA